MNRIGYLVIAVLIVGLAAYLFWPQAVVGEGVPLFDRPEPAEFVVKAAGLEQRVTGRTVTVAGLDRPVDAQRVAGLWTMLHAIAVPKAKIVDPVAPDQLSAYGIDGTREISATAPTALTLRWGESGGNGYIWDGHRLFNVPEPAVARLETAAGRLDVMAALPSAGSIERIDTGAAVVERTATGWRDTRHPERATCTVRAGHLLGRIAALQLANLAPAAATEPACVLHVSSAHPAEEHVVTLGAMPGGAAGGTIAVDALPAQRIGIDEFTGWKHDCDELAHDYLVDLDPGQARVDIEHVVAQLGGRPWFSADRRQASFRPGETDWDVSWEGGREAASEDSVASLLAVLAAIPIEDSAAGPSPLPASLTARRLCLVHQNGGIDDITIDGDQAWTPTHHGRVAVLPAMLASLEPATLLDRALTVPAPERVEKLQRQEFAHQPPAQEVVARAEDGTWSRTFPAPAPGTSRAAVDAVVVGRLARALCAARATSVRLLTDEDRATLEHPVFELDARFAPRAAGAPSMEIADERDTVPQDRGFAFAPESPAQAATNAGGGGAWRAVDKEGGVSYLLDAETVDILRAPIDADALYPVVPGLVRTIEVVTAKERYVIERGDQGWTVRDADAANGSSPPSPPEPANEIEVRRLFRDLAELRALSREPTAAPLLPTAASATICCAMPASAGETERLTLTIGGAENGSAPASIDSTRPQTPVPKGRVRLAAAAIIKIAPQRSRFVAPSAVPSAPQPLSP